MSKQRSKQMTRVILSGVTGLMALGSFSTIAQAATTRSAVEVTRAAYLFSTPHLGSHRIALESTGSSLQTLSGSTQAWWHVKDSLGRTGYITRNTHWTTTLSEGTSATTTSGQVSTSTAGSATTSSQLPPGVRYDSSVHPLAPLNASYQAKVDAVLQVAKGKLGTPYIWGHNEDRGQYGFDCSNYTAYVYHHALGYKMSGASQVQYHSVGTPVPIKNMRPGDLVIMDKGGHVGIYVGNGQMIQEGGGLKKVGYLPLHPGSYWYKHITVVKRMF
ncbi:C40 family peptidase [Ferroacidibacillus organovorans]|uniref:C40 family peptidase n=1 Tax=Ferroacidibacillus organovorans TaxID=1765683 RepID=UPI000AA7311D|nr:NlpC/P60 family protein [Ferroacidibacillus organovorans]